MRFLVLALCASIIFVSCKEKGQPEKPAESYNGSIQASQPMSALTIPFNFQAKDIENAINAKLSGTLYEDNNIEDDDLMVKATKTQPIKFGIDGQAFTYKVPLKIWLKRALPLGSVEADGEIALSFTTRYTITEDWNFKTITTISKYDWIKTPKLKAGFVELPITYIANEMLNRMQSQLTAPLDQQLGKAFDLKVTMRDAWNSMQNPVNMSQEYGMWLKMTPSAIQMAPLKNVNGLIKGLIRVDAYTDIAFGAAPKFRSNTSLPSFKWSTFTDTQDSFQMHVMTDVPYPEAERLANQFMRGYTYTQGKRSVTINDMHLYGQDDRMVVETAMSGAFNGKIYLVGKPVFDAATNSIRMADLDFDLGTKNFMLKSAKWMFDRVLVNKIEKSLVFPLDQNLTDLKQSITTQLTNYQVSPNLTLNGNIRDIKVASVGLNSGGIQILITSSGKLMADIKNLGM